MFADMKIQAKIRAIKTVIKLCDKFDIAHNIRDGILDELQDAASAKDYGRVLDLYEELSNAVAGEEANT